MTPARLSALDASFLTAETRNAHMHVGWVARFDPPEGGANPTFEQLREHIGRRLHRAPRYRQRLAPVPFGLTSPEWVDDGNFDLDRHVIRSRAAEVGDAMQEALSTQLDRDHPLWEIHICDSLSDGSLGLVGKVHHCMVDGVAAVELAALLLDPTPEPPEEAPDDWQPAPSPTPLELLARGVTRRVSEGMALAAAPAKVLAAPGQVLTDARRVATALMQIGGPARPHEALNEPISPLRHLGTVSREMEELRTIKRRFGVSLNDVVLAACTGAMRRFLLARHEEPAPLKAMVPVNVRGDGDDLGNRISFVFVSLPCDEPDPVSRLMCVHASMRRRKRSGGPRGGEAVLDALRLAPQLVQRAAARVIASPWTFNLVVSNIPGPPVPLYLHGCRLLETYPVVPLADRHALSIGFTSIEDRACFGLYVDRAALPDVADLGTEIDREIDGLLALAGERAREVRELAPA